MSLASNEASNEASLASNEASNMDGVLDNLFCCSMQDALRRLSHDRVPGDDSGFRRSRRPITPVQKDVPKVIDYAFCARLIKIPGSTGLR